MPTEVGLAEQGVSVEQLVGAFFHVVEPYVGMWSDLLAMFERAAANAGTENLAIAYDFGAGGIDGLKFDIASFRRVIETAAATRAQFDLRGEDLSSQLWELAQAFPWSDDVSAARPYDAGALEVVREFARQCRESAWPTQLPARPPASDARLDKLLTESWQLFDTVLTELRSVSTDHDDLMRRARSNDASSHVQALAQFESDYWLPTAVERFFVGAHSVTATPVRSAADAIDAVLPHLRNTDPDLRALHRRLAQFLSLPVWRYRYELYSNWVCTQVITALAASEPTIHSSGGRIEFAFSGTHLATFDALSPRLHLWTELRMPLDRPIGKVGKELFSPTFRFSATRFQAGSRRSRSSASSTVGLTTERSPTP